jgi:dipeptidyl aminopeptidase/acylaminoacyl peptidase
VGLYSPVDLTDGYRHPPAPDIVGSRPLESAFIGGTPDDRGEAYWDTSPITCADRRHPPVLLIHDGRDVIVTPALARLFD